MPDSSGLLKAFLSVEPNHIHGKFCKTCQFCTMKGNVIYCENTIFEPTKIKESDKACYLHEKRESQLKLEL